MPHPIDLRDGGTIFYDESFFGIEEADALFDELRTHAPWKQEQSRFGPVPRLTAWYADAGMSYTYSGVTHEAIQWTPALSEIRRRVEAVAQTPFNSLLLNLYRDGNDSVGFHADDEPELGIASISLGGVRQFVMRHINSGDKPKYDLAHGSLLIMGGTCQHHWLHSVPKTKAFVGPRINLTFRNIVGSK